MCAIDEFYRVTVPQLRAKFLPPADRLDDLLEHHARAYILDELLASMGYTTRPTGGDFINLLTEAFIRGDHTKPHTLFLDYLGMDGLANLPLLVFEAKRFGLAGPGTLVAAFERKLASRVSKPSGGKLDTSLPEALAAAFRRPASVTEEWSDHIKQLKKYYKAIVKKFGQPPAVMAIGNGEWLVMIHNPKEVFTGTPSAACFWVLDEPGQPGEAYRRHYDEIHAALAYERLAPQSPYLFPESLPHSLRQAPTVELTRGLHLGYTTEPPTPQRPGLRPRIDIRPLVFVRSPGQPWLAVGLLDDGFTLPHENKGSEILERHLGEVITASDGLIARVKAQLAHAPTEIDLVTISKEAAAAGRPLVGREPNLPGSSTQSFVLLTGTRAHFLQAQPHIASCPYHEWSQCSDYAVGRHPPGAPISAATYSGQRAFFPNGRHHHCAADATYRVKADLQFLPSLSATDTASIAGAVFCKIFDFESMLCCQTCVFLSVCAAAQTFRVPCPRAAPQA